MAKKDKFNLQQGFDKELNIESIISAPLIAASKANAFMLSGQYRFLLDNCFSKDESGHFVPEMIKMTLSRAQVVEDDNEGRKIVKNDMVFTVPKLSLMPFSSLAVKDVSVTFDLEVIAVTSYNSEHGVLDKQAQLKGRITDGHSPNDSGKNRSQQSSKLKVNINAREIPLPPGLLNIIDLYNKSIHPVPKKPKEDNDSNS